MKNLSLKKETLVILEDHQVAGVYGASDGGVVITLAVGVFVGEVIAYMKDCAANKGNGGPDPIYVY